MLDLSCLRLCGLKGTPRTAQTTRALWFVLISMVFALSTGEALAAEQRFEVGDEVEVLFLREWRSGRVLQTDPRGAVGVEYEFAATSQQRVFAQNQVRLKCEIDALAPVREWKDASGKFRIRAALLRYTGKQVTLRKVDMEEIDVPASALGNSDQRYLAKFKKETSGDSKGRVGLATVERFAGTPEAARENSFNGGPGLKEALDTARDMGMPMARGVDIDVPFGKDKKSRPMSFGGEADPQSAASSAEDLERRALTPDPAPGHLTFTQGGAAFPMDGIDNEIGAVLPVGGSDGWVLASVEPAHGSIVLGDQTTTHLLWVSLTNKKLEKIQTLPFSDLVLDYHAASHRLLTCSQSDPGKEVVLSIWQVLPTDDRSQSVLRWATPPPPHGDTPWARLVNGNTVIQRLGEHDYVGWDLAKKALRYRIQQEVFAEPVPVLSGTGKYFVLPEERRVRVFDAVSGENVCTLPQKHQVSGVAVSRDGRYLAVLNRTGLSVWDLTAPEASPRCLKADAISSGADMTMAWLDDQYLMAASGPGTLTLLNLNHDMALWSYRFGLDVVRGSERAYALVGDHLIYAAEINERGQEAVAIGAVRLPGADAEEAAAKLNSDTLMKIRRGSPIRLEVSVGKHEEQVRASLERHARNNGWNLDPNAPNVLVAEVKPGKPRQVTCNFHGRRPNETARVTPRIHSVRVLCDGTTVWEYNVHYGLSGSLSLGEGDTVQSAVDKMEKVDPTFFDRAKIPERILDPKYKRGLGASTVSNRGLVRGNN